MLLRGRINGGVNIPESLHSLFQILLVTILMQLLLFPVIYKLGVEKARFVYMAVFICLSLGVLGLSRLDDNGAVLAGLRLDVEKIMQYGEIVAVILAAAGLFLSLRLSVRIYEKKEF